ncbi:MAG: polynucleotidyl transferase [Synechococcus sp. MED850]|nr:polynucleotidyl transferase [Synechococcus sp. MED850]
MSGWLLVLALLVLGGVLSTLGDRLGSRVGKARLSLFNMRPRRTAVVITVLTGSLISALSLGLMLLVSRQLRVGLFELDALQSKLQSSRNELDSNRKQLDSNRKQLETNRRALASAEADRRKARAETLRVEAELAPLQQQRDTLEKERERLSRDVKARDAEIQRTEAELAKVRERIRAGEQELKQLERNLIALRRGAVVLSSGETLATATVRLDDPTQAKNVIDRLLQEANLTAFAKVRPGEAPDRQILLVPRSDVQRLRTMISKPGTWVVSMRSAANVLRGETSVYAFPDVRPNRTVARQNEVLATATLEESDRSQDTIRTRLNLLLASAFAEVKRRGSLTEGLQFDANAMSQLGQALSDEPDGPVTLQVLAARNSESADPVVVSLRIVP